MFRAIMCLCLAWCLIKLSLPPLSINTFVFPLLCVSLCLCLFPFLLFIPLPDSNARFHVSFITACWRAHYGNQHGVKPSQWSGQREPHVFLHRQTDTHTHMHNQLDTVQITAEWNCNHTREEELRFWTSVVEESWAQSELRCSALRWAAQMFGSKCHRKLEHFLHIIIRHFVWGLMQIRKV